MSLTNKGKNMESTTNTYQEENLVSALLWRINTFLKNCDKSESPTISNDADQIGELADIYNTIEDLIQASGETTLFRSLIDQKFTANSIYPEEVKQWIAEEIERGKGTK